MKIIEETGKYIIEGEEEDSDALSQFVYSKILEIKAFAKLSEKS